MEKIPASKGVVLYTTGGEGYRATSALTPGKVISDFA